MELRCRRVGWSSSETVRRGSGGGCGSRKSSVVGDELRVDGPAHTGYEPSLSQRRIGANGSTGLNLRQSNNVRLVLKKAPGNAG